MNPADLPDAKDPAARRSFLTRISALVAGAIVTLFPFAAGWGVLTDPLYRGRDGANDGDDSESVGFVRICLLESLPADGVPHAFAVTADVADAWTRAPGQRIGEVFVSRSDIKGTPRITAFTATCPHLGCAVEFDAADGRFKCPCHESAFDKDGKKLFGPSRRGLDALKWKIDDDDGTPEIWVAFERFQAGLAEGKPVG